MREKSHHNGAIVCKGAVTVTGSLNLESDLVALVAQGDVFIDGLGKEGGTRMQGLVYTNGSFKAEDSTVVGAIVSAQVDGTTQLDRVNMVQVPGATNFEVVVDKKLKLIVDPGRLAYQGLDIGLFFQGRFTPFVPGNEPIMRELAEQLAALPVGERGVIEVRDANGNVISAAGAGNEFIEKRGIWNTYISDVAANTVERTEIFSLDLNSFLSVQGELEVLLWKSYRQRVDEQDA